MFCVIAFHSQTRHIIWIKSVKKLENDGLIYVAVAAEHSLEMLNILSLVACSSRFSCFMSHGDFIIFSQVEIHENSWKRFGIYLCTRIKGMIHLIAWK